jgi:nucleotide-binding universal stress UspA family protein
MSFKHILVATDFSEPSNKALDLCRELAAPSGAKVTLVHAYPNIFYAVQGVPAAPLAPTKEQLAEIKARTEEALERIRGEHLEGVPFVHVQLLACESPGRAICDHAAEIGADLVIVGSHGRTGLTKLLVGSVAEQVIKLAPCPVLVAR